MKKRTKTTFIANDSEEAIELKELLEKAGHDVEHIHGGSSKPVLIPPNGIPTVGAGNIRWLHT